MDQQLNELCIKCETDSNLETCLGKYTKPKLKEILDLYGVKMSSAAKKQEMAEKAEEVIKENIISFFNGEGADRKSDMQSIISDGMTLTAAEDLEKIKDFLERGLVYLTSDGESAQVVVPVNVRAIMELVDESGHMADDGSYGRESREPVGERSEQDAEVIKYAAALANIYGVYPASQLKEVWDFNHQRGIAPKDIVSAIEKSGDVDGFYVNDGYIINVSLKNVEDYIEVLTCLSRADIYFYPAEEVIEEFADGPAYKVAPEYYMLRSYFERKLGSEEKAEELLKELFLLAVRDTAVEEVAANIKSRGIVIEDGEDADRFTYLYICWCYELRGWSCKGYKPSELREEKLARLNIKKAVDDTGADVKKIRLTGRNDECPCGSGKKFKKCCMKYAE